jgi:hypothetical protein
MDIDRKFFIEVVGLLAVVLSLIFLGLEVQQNSLLMRSQVRDSITDKQIAFFSLIAGNSETANSVQKAIAGAPDMSPAEQQQFLHWSSAALRMWENEWYQYQNGLFDQSEFTPRMEVWRALARNPSFRDQWRSSMTRYSPDFREQMDILIEE